MSNYITITNNENESQVYTEEHLIDMVKLRMDEIDQQVRQIVDVGVIDNKPITDIIGGLLNECRIDVLKNAVPNKVPKVKTDINLTGNSFEAPNDSLRLLSISATGWKKVVNHILDTTSKDYHIQSYDYIKSNINNPKVFSIDGSTFEVFPTPSDSKVKITTVSSNTPFESLSEDMINAVCWICAGKTFLAMGMMDNAAKSIEIYSSIIK